MSRGGRGKFAKVAGLIGAAVAAYVLFSNLTAHSDVLEGEAAYRSDIHRENANYRIVWVCKSAPSEQACIDEARQSARENEREEQDLAAQKITAWWTKVMGVAALIGMALSAVGVWLVKTTFDETRRANIIAIAQSAHEIGPKITIDSVEVKLKDTYFFVDLLVRNSGDGQANSVRAEGRYRVWRDFEERIKMRTKWRRTKLSQSSYFSKEIAPGGVGDVTVYWSGHDVTP